MPLDYQSHSMIRNVALLLGALLYSLSTTSAFAAPWTFVSSPDLFNSDVADLSGGTDAAVAALFDASYSSNLVQAAGWPTASGGKNGVTASMASVYSQLIQEMVTNAGGSPEAFVAAGDLTNGRWFNTDTLNMFDPGGTNFGKLNNAADVYFSWYRELFRQNGIDTVIGAIGDHDIGDNDWSTGSTKANHVDTMKVAFGRNMVDPLNLPATWNGVSSTAPQNGVSEYDEGSFIKQINNVLFVTVDIFEYSGAGTSQHYRYGAVDADVSGTASDSSSHLGWLDDVLDAADADSSVDHVIVQGHAPALSGVRKQASSGMMMRDREEGGFWQVLQDHSHENGGKVRMYFAGEVHTNTASKDTGSDIVQLVHGNPPLGNGSGNYVVFNVDEDTIQADLYQFDLTHTSSSYWQPSKNNSNGPDSMTSGTLTGSLTIDVSDPETTYQTSGWMNLVDPDGLLVHYAFEGVNAAGRQSNTGHLGDLWYDANINGDPTTVAGKFGNALNFDNTGDLLKTAGGLAPVTEGEDRTVTAWIRTTGTEFDTFFGYGQDNSANGEFNVRIASGELHLHIDTSTIASTNGGPTTLNDGQWHHVAVVLPEKHENMLSDVLFYVDGVQYTASLSNGDRPIRTYAGSASNIFIGADAENLGTNNHFDGDIDDVALWGSALSSGKVMAMYNAGNHPGLTYDLLEMNTLFELFEANNGSALVDGVLWQNYSSNITDGAGQVLDLAGGHFAIMLDDLGNGLITTLSIGDFDGNGIVDDDDLAQWQSDFGQAGQSDANNDGVSDGLDFLTWQSNYGTDVNAASGRIAVVPEPSTTLSGAGMLFFFLSKRRRQP